VSQPPQASAELGDVAALLDQAIDEQAAWMHGVYHAIIRRAEPGPEIAGDNAHLLTRFGLWYETHRADPLVAQPAFRALGELHRSLHSGARIICGRASKRPDIPREELEALAVKSRNFVAQARRLQAAFRHAQADLDPLTGVRNRQRMLGELDKERERAQRTGLPAAVALVDLDRFKAINDSHGHAVGDRVLAHAAAVLAERLRSYDLMFRYGGEEFLFCLPAADENVAGGILERLRAGLESQPCDLGEGRSVAVTTSIGFTLMEHGVGPERAIERADTALYRAKQEGRNRVVVWREPLPLRPETKG